MSTDEVFGPEDWRQLTQAPQPVMPGIVSIPCAAIKDDGEPCGNHAIKGMVFCQFHGGHTLAVQDQTRRRLDMVRSQLFETLVEAAGAAVDTYISIMHNGKKDADRLRAADRVLELLGVRDQVVEINVKHSVEPTDIEQELFVLLAAVTEERLGEVIEISEHSTS